MAYTTLRGPGRVEIEVKKSRFIGQAAPAAGEEAALRFIAQVRAEHPKATHHCFAWRAGGSDRLSDDGEPSGTAGRPIFEVITRKGLADTVVVVTRYFGGTLLGAGGLVRAYAQAAAAAVEAAGLVTARPALDLQLSLGYELLGKAQHLLSQRPALVLATQYGPAVTLRVRVLAAEAPLLEAELAEGSAGRIAVDRLQEVLVGPDLQALHSEVAEAEGSQRQER